MLVTIFERTPTTSKKNPYKVGQVTNKNNLLLFNFFWNFIKDIHLKLCTACIKLILVNWPPTPCFNHHHHLFWKRPSFHAKLGLDVFPQIKSLHISTYPHTPCIGTVAIDLLITSCYWNVIIEGSVMVGFKILVGYEIMWNNSSVGRLNTLVSQTSCFLFHYKSTSVLLQVVEISSQKAFYKVKITVGLGFDPMEQSFEKCPHRAWG